MKQLILMALLIYTIAADAQVQPNKNGYVHPKIIPTHFTNLTSVNISRYKGQDTFVITSTNSGNWMIQQDSGLSWDHPLVFINTSTKQVLSTGVLSENCQYIKIIGYGSDSAYGFEFRGGGVPGSFGGMYKGLLLEGCRFTGGNAGPLWVKEEAPHACDFYNFWRTKGTADSLKYGVIANYLAPFYQDSVFIRHCWIDSSGGDGYLGSTGTIHGRDAVPCLNNTTPPTMQTRNFHFDSNYVNYLGRSGVQLSLAVAGNQTINDNIITNCGYEWPEAGYPNPNAPSRSQGAGVRTGSGDVSVEIARNHVDYTNLYNYDIEEANCNFHDNYGNHVSFVVYHGAPFAGGQALPSTIAFASDPQQSPLLIRSNQMYNTTGGNNIAYAIYGGNNFNLNTNDTCFNIGVVARLATPFVALSTCSGAGCDTTFHDSTYHITHDSIVVGHFGPILVYRDTVINIYLGQDTNFLKNKHYIIRVAMKKAHALLIDTVRQAYDSAYICSLCASHDTTVSVRTIICMIKNDKLKQLEQWIEQQTASRQMVLNYYNDKSGLYDDKIKR